MGLGSCYASYGTPRRSSFLLAKECTYTYIYIYARARTYSSHDATREVLRLRDNAEGSPQRAERNREELTARVRTGEETRGRNSRRGEDEGGQRITPSVLLPSLPPSPPSISSAAACNIGRLLYLSSPRGCSPLNARLICKLIKQFVTSRRVFNVLPPSRLFHPPPPSPPSSSPLTSFFFRFPGVRRLRGGTSCIGLRRGLMKFSRVLISQLTACD